MSPETCWADLRRLINEKVVASCLLFTSLQFNKIHLSLSTGQNICTSVKIQNSAMCLRWLTEDFSWLGYLEFGHPRCVYNNEVKYNEGQNTTKFIS